MKDHLCVRQRSVLRIVDDAPKSTNVGSQQRTDLLSRTRWDSLSDDGSQVDTNRLVALNF
jgi:hypothetical protein